MKDAKQRLERLVAEELAQPAPPAACRVADDIRRRHGAAVAAILFYGSCLRRGTIEDSVLDLYVLVDRYRDAYESRVLAWSNALLPPNVFYVEVPGHSEPTIRAKYAVISTADFEASCRPGSGHAIVWGRFSQPAVFVYTRTPEVRERVVAAVAEAVETMVEHGVALLADDHGAVSATPESIWQVALRSTYATELRTESLETIGSIVSAAPARYVAASALALEALAVRGVVQGRAGDAKLRVDLDRVRYWQVRWKRRRPLVKALYALRLVKSALTFGDWLPYALWKLNRHSGVRIEPTPRQRRHPFLFGWPVIIRLLRQQKLR